MEVWRDIIGYEELYKVSNHGRIKSLNYNKTGKEKILKLFNDKNGYKIVTLSKNGKSKKYKVHRLVAEVFIPNPNNYTIINHKDECKYNNCVENLEWCNHKYNSNYGTRNKRISINNIGKHKNNKTSIQKKVKCITTGEIFDGAKYASEKYNICYVNILRCCKGERSYAGKHPITKDKMIWEYYND